MTDKCLEAREIFGFFFSLKKCYMMTFSVVYSLKRKQTWVFGERACGLSYLAASLRLRFGSVVSHQAPNTALGFHPQCVGKVVCIYGVENTS